MVGNLVATILHRVIRTAQKYFSANIHSYRSNNKIHTRYLGLYHWFDNNMEEAVQYFNCVKYDPEWGQQALHNMVEIYLAGSEHHETAESLLQVYLVHFSKCTKSLLPSHSKLEKWEKVLSGGQSE